MVQRQDWTGQDCWQPVREGSSRVLTADLQVWSEQTFCALGNFTAVTATETVLCEFVAKLGSEGLGHRTIEAYLSAIWHLEGMEDPFLSPPYYILRGGKGGSPQRAEWNCLVS